MQLMLHSLLFVCRQTWVHALMSASMTMQDIAAKIGDVLRPYSKGSRVGLDTRDRLQRVLKQTQPIATTDLRPLFTEEGPTENGDAPSQPPPREDPVRLKLSPSWQVSLCCPVVLALVNSCTQDFVRCILPGSTSGLVLRFNIRTCTVCGRGVLHWM